MNEFVPLYIPGSSGFAIVDAEDFERVSTLSLHSRSDHGKSYIYFDYKDELSGKVKQICLSHIILNLNVSEDRHCVYYKNGNPFDLRKSNLSTHRTTPTVRKPESGIRSIYVYLDKHRQKEQPNGMAWAINAAFFNLSKEYRLGRFISEEAANGALSFVVVGDFTINNEFDVAMLRASVRQWVVENGFIKDGGRRPYRSTVAREIGFERERADNGRIEIKTENGFVLKHHLVWLEHGNTLPPNHIVEFIDGNERNFDINNLKPVSRAELLRQGRLNQYPAEIQSAVDAIWTLNSEVARQAKKESRKRTRNLKIKGADKPAIVDKEDFSGLSRLNYKLIRTGKTSRIIARSVKIGKKYKQIPLSYKILGIKKERVRVSHKNGNIFDFRKKNLEVNYCDRPRVSRLSKNVRLYINYVKARVGAASNWRVTLRKEKVNIHIGYYLTEESANAVIAKIHEINPSVETVEEITSLRNQVRDWALELGYTNRPYGPANLNRVSDGKIVRVKSAENYPFRISYHRDNSRTRSPWAVVAAYSSQWYKVGYFVTEDGAKAVIAFINAYNLPVTNKEQIAQLRIDVKLWAEKKGYYICISPRSNEGLQNKEASASESLTPEIVNSEIPVSEKIEKFRQIISALPSRSVSTNHENSFSLIPTLKLEGQTYA